MISLRKTYKLGIISIFVIGIILRLILFIKNPSFIYDESSLALNIIHHSYKDLFNGLDSLQVAPPLFLILSKFLYNALSPANDYFRDLTFRIIPFISGVCTLPLFYLFFKKISANKRHIALALFIFTFNPISISYCVQFKQYSLELFTALVLLFVYYRIIFENKLKITDIITIAIAPWFSLSSFFITAAGLIILLVKKEIKKSGIISLPLLISCILFYTLYLKSVYSINYAGMDNFWASQYGFLDFTHPTRLLIRLGEFYTFKKAFAIPLGLYTVFCALAFLFTNRFSKLFKTFLFLPIALTLLASLLHLYPLAARLILFWLPMVTIFIAESDFKFNPQLTSIFCIITLLLSCLYINNPIGTSHREAVIYIKNSINPTDKIITDSDYNTFKYYAEGKSINNEVTSLPFICADKKQENSCREALDKFTEGKYYFIAPFKMSDKIVNTGCDITTKDFAASTVICFIKK